jgi:4-hydroxy-tetrahydrodipicolinate reductase
MKNIRKIKFGILGASGRMGREVKAYIESQGQGVVAEISSKNLQEFFRKKNLERPDVWIDFSQPEALDKMLDYLNQYPTPLVSGTTGLTPQQLSRLKKYSKKTAVFWAPNMSVGVALVMKMLEVFDFFHEFDFQIDETHHRLKKDKPSGTALLLQGRLQAVVGKKNLPPPLSIRGGGVFGIHRLQAMADEEVISIEHTALNRKVFAKGAVWAAHQIMHYKSGYFEMKDLLKL